MAAFAEQALLSAWEQVHPSPPAARPSALLRAFGRPDPATVGARDEALLAVYCEYFGEWLDGVARCPACGTDVEINVAVDQLRAGIPAAEPVEPFSAGDSTVHWRLPDPADLAAAASADDAEAGALLLLTRVVVDAPWSAAELPAPVRERLAEKITAADPYADIVFSLVCPQCDAVFSSELDVAEFVWAHLRSRVERLLREVDEIARAYHWSEPQILALPPERRRMYLELIRHG
jgi:hypothetical protein